MASLTTVCSVGVIRTRKEVDPIITMLRCCPGAFNDLLGRFKIDLCVVESQHFHAGGSSPAADILKLAQVAGGIVGQLTLLDPTMKMLLVKPTDWKGQTPKPINQARTLAHYGIVFDRGKDYCTPGGCAVAAKIEGSHKVNPGDWKHIGDALGLALHGARLLSSWRS